MKNIGKVLDVMELGFYIMLIGCFIVILFHVVNANDVNPWHEESIQDLCYYCNKIYGNGNDYTTNRLFILSNDEAKSFCHEKGFYSGYIDSSICDKGIECYNKNDDGSFYSKCFTDLEGFCVEERGCFS